MLEAAGLSATEEATYLALLDGGAASVEELITRTGQTEVQTSRAVTGLNTLGLVQRTPPPHDLVVPVPPDVGVEALIQRRHEQLDGVRETVRQLAAQIRDRTSNRRIGELIEIVQGRAQVHAAFERVQRSAKTEMRVLVAPPYAARSPVNRTQHDLENRLHWRAVYETDVLAEPGFMEAISDHIRGGEQARLSPNVPIKLAIADRTLALLPLVWTDAAQDSAMLVHPCGLLDALVALFESVWASASPLVISAINPDESEPAPELTGLKRELLSLLVAGLTDEAAGARLGLSRRTVLRLVQQLMVATGSRSRLQLGWRAHERGWLTRMEAAPSP
jgi:DNA-binding CsgD family transcriptional regulator